MLRTQCVSISVAFAIVAGLSGPVAADDRATPRPPTPTPPPTNTITQIETLRPLEADSLLREGSRLVQARGRIAHHAESNSWRLVVDPPSEAMPRYVFTVLPSSFLAEVQAVLEVAGNDRQFAFEVGGEVLVDNARNYLLLTHPPRVVAHTDEGEGDTEANGEDDEPRSRDAASIMRELERETGPLQRRPGRSGDVESARRSRASEDDDLMPEGTTLVMRRGSVSRGSTGAWKFVFEADASGLADPPMILLPCMTLQRLERHAQTRGNEPILLSGRVFVYEGRNYLLPTVFQRPYERNSVQP